MSRFGLAHAKPPQGPPVNASRVHAGPGVMSSKTSETRDGIQTGGFFVEELGMTSEVVGSVPVTVDPA